MKTNRFLIFFLVFSLAFRCTDRNTPSLLIGTWQAITISIGSISLDLKTDSLTLPPEYWQDRIDLTPGSPEYAFDSLVLVELRTQFKNSLMANQINFNKHGQFEIRPKSEKTQEGTFRHLSKDKIEFAIKDSNTIKPTFHFDLKHDLLYLSQVGDKPLEVVYKKIQ